MKLALLTLSLLLLAFIAYPSLSKAELVFDTDCDPLLPGSRYYVVPFNKSQGGGLRLAKISNSDCPVDVVQSEFSSGRSLLFQPITKIGRIPTDTPLSVSFAETPNCAPESSKWILPLNSTSETSFVTIGVEPPLHQEGFEIKRYEETNSPTYKFVYNPKVSVIQRTLGIGITVEENGTRRLAATVSLDDPNPIPALVVVFRKASYENAEIPMKTA